MIYIVGHTFQFDTRPQVSKTSIQEQMALAKYAYTPKQSSAFDSRFIPGNTYRIALIQKVLVDDTPKIQYLFANMSNTSLPDIDVKMDSTSAGDDYVAAISGQQQQLADERELIKSARELDHDI